MLRKLFCIALIFGMSQAVAQDRSLAKLDSIISTHVCSCFNSIQNAGMADLEGCLGRAIMKDSVLFLEEIRKHTSDTTYEAGYEFGRKLSKRILVDLIRDCDVFYHMFDSLRRSGLNELDLDSLRKVAANYLSQSGNAPTVEYFFSQGLVHVREGKWADGLADFDAALKLKPDTENLLFLRAYCLENLGRYNESIALYEALAKGTGKEDYRAFAAIVKRLKIDHP